MQKELNVHSTVFPLARGGGGGEWDNSIQMIPVIPMGAKTSHH